MKRTDAYQFTVEMENGKPVGNDAILVNAFREKITEQNKNRPKGANRKYVKLQGRLGKDNPNAIKYRRRPNMNVPLNIDYYYSHQAIRLPDAKTADVYVYTRWD